MARIDFLELNHLHLFAGPEHHMYARDHGSFDRFGSYDHPPIAVEPLASAAIAAWEPSFDGVVAKAFSHFSDPMNRAGLEAFNGVFSVTPDSLPLAGPLQQVEGLWGGISCLDNSCKWSS